MIERLFSFTFVALLLSLSLSFPLYAEDAQTPSDDETEIALADVSKPDEAYAQALSFEKEKNYEMAEYWFRFAVYRGDGRAALALKKLKDEGHISAPDADSLHSVGIALIESNAQKGSAGDSLFLGLSAMRGTFDKPDYDKARTWLELAADQGSASAAYFLGINYLNGLYEAINPARAMPYFKRAAEKGHRLSLRQLGIASYTGIGTKQDKKAALAYFKRAAEAGSVLAMRDLALFYKIENNDIAGYTHWLEKAAEQNDPDALYYIALLYKDTSPEKHRAYLQRAKDLKHHLAEVAYKKEETKK